MISNDVATKSVYCRYVERAQQGEPQSNAQDFRPDSEKKVCREGLKILKESLGENTLLLRML